MVDTYRAVRQFERLLGYRGPETLYSAPKHRTTSPFNLETPTVREVFNGESMLIAFPIEYDNGDSRWVRSEDYIRENLGKLCSLLHYKIVSD